MNNNLNEEKKVFAANGIKNTGFYYTKSLIQDFCYWGQEHRNDKI